MPNWLNWTRGAIKSVVADFGTVCLGAAAILLTRALPANSFTDFDPGVLAATVFFVLLGVLLRAIARL